MWLINTETLQLKNIFEPEADGIRYAILSHTWGSEEDEVTFQDFHEWKTNKAIKLRPGFTKIKKTCELARSEGYQYVWIDTCCIDKTSSAELTEAINSMFRWYSASDVCYVYLEDLHDDEPFRGLPLGLDSIPVMTGCKKEMVEESPFAKCRWFTRGWTLQELIAPSDVVFYDAKWRRIVTRGSLCQTLELITGVDALTLIDNTHLFTQPVYIRMRWAARRETKRTEDMAYCLLGLFDVNMPLIYGEGYKAFQRLQEEITRSEGDPSILVWSGHDLPLPQHRPAEYRNARVPPQYRGPYAWAPSEFLLPKSGLHSVLQFSKPTSTHVAVPIKAQVGPQSSVLISSEPRELRWGKGGEMTTHVEVPTPEGFFCRLVERTAEGYLFKSTSVKRGNLSNVKSIHETQDFRLLGQSTATRIDIFKKKTIWLGRVDYTDLKGHKGSLFNERVWPEGRWDAKRLVWLYEDAELHRLFTAPMTILGILVFHVPGFEDLPLAAVVGTQGYSPGHPPFSPRMFAMILAEHSSGGTFGTLISSEIRSAIFHSDLHQAAQKLQFVLQQSPRPCDSGNSEKTEVWSKAGGAKTDLTITSVFPDWVGEGEKDQYIWGFQLMLHSTSPTPAPDLGSIPSRFSRSIHSQSSTSN